MTTGNFDLFNPRVLAFIEAHALDLCKTIEAGLKASAIEAIAEGMKLGESIPKIRRRLTDIVENYSKVNAQRVARTEAIRASNEGNLEAYRQSGIVRGKVWLAAPDSCEECSALDGVEVVLNEDFPGGYDCPPAHPNCRCTVVAVV